MTPITETAHLGGNAGVSFRYSGHNHCGLQVEVNYQQRGWREVNKTSGIDYQRTLHYISVPFLTHIYFGKNGANGFINLGPQIGYCFRDVAKGTKNPSLAHQYDALDQPFDWGIAGGVGFYYKTKKAGIYQIDIRVDYSLGTIYNTRTTDYFSQANPLDVSINLGYYWEFKGKGGRR